MTEPQQPLSRAQKLSHALAEKQQNRIEVFRVGGDNLVPKVSQLLKEGNTHRIMVLDPSGAILVDIPTALGVVGTLLFPAAAALAVAGTVAANLRIVVEKKPSEVS
jgi:DUF4097 and DUF4098 domain-containing protein YvlB